MWQEHEPRTRLQAPEIAPEEERARLRELEVQRDRELVSALSPAAA